MARSPLKSISDFRISVFYHPGFGGHKKKAPGDTKSYKPAAFPKKHNLNTFSCYDSARRYGGEIRGAAFFPEG